LPLTGCKGGLVKGSGTLKTRDIFLTDFSEVKAADAFEVKIIYAASYNITVTADDNLLEHIKVSKKGETLTLALNRADYVDTSVKAVITMPHLRRLSLSGNSKGSIAGFDTRAGITFNLSGDSFLSTANMTVGDITLDVSDASKVTGNLTARDVHIKAESGSTIQLGGTSVVTSDNGTLIESIKYYAFGETRSITGPDVTDKLFTGQRLDDTGLYYYNARYYDPTIGRFISPDTVIPR
jgi:hypothetical protein